MFEEICNREADRHTHESHLNCEIWGGRIYNVLISVHQREMESDQIDEFAI